MIVRQLVEFIIIPKTFNVLSFYSKGHYALRVRLEAQDTETGETIKGFPVMIEGKETQTDQRKKAKVDSEECYYQTSHFFVTFSEQKIIFNSACLFRIQYEQGRNYKTSICFDLISTSFKRAVGDEPPPTKIADRRTIYINNVNNLKTFKRVLFDDSDYFSMTDVYMLAQPMGEKIRHFDYQYREFSALSHEQKQQRHHETFDKMIAISEQRGSMFIDIFGMTAVEFHSKMIGEKVVRYRKLCQLYQDFRFKMRNVIDLPKQPSLDGMQWISTDTARSEASLLARYQTEDVSQLYMRIYQESQLIIRNTRHIWQSLIKLLSMASPHLMDILASPDIDAQRKAKGNWLINYNNIDSEHREKQKYEFLSRRQSILSLMNVYEDMDRYHPFLIVQNHEKVETTASGDTQGLVVFIHGYQGSSIDMQKARNFMKIYNPNCQALLIKSIEDEMDESIEHLGKMIADEVKLHLTNVLNIYKRISFVGYSLGGILAREAVKHLTRYKHLMHLFVSFASPHAGISEATNRLVRTGIWFLTNFEKNKNLKQLNCQSITQDEMLTLETLSQSQSISWFKKFVAVSSREDDFVPYHSSRLEEDSMGDKTKQICLNLKQRIKRLERVEVWFDVEHSCGTWDRITGRKAHIQFLQNRVFLDSFFAIYAPMF